MSYWSESDKMAAKRCLDIIDERRLAYHEVQKFAEVRALDGAAHEIAKAFGLLANPG